MAVHSDVFLPHNLDVQVIEVVGGVTLALRETGDYARPGCSLFFGDLARPGSWDVARRQLDSLAAAVTAARMILGPDPAELARTERGADAWADRVDAAQDELNRPPASRWCVDVDPQDPYRWAVYVGATGELAGQGMTLSRATELVETLAGEAWAAAHPESQAHPGRLPLREGDDLPRLAYPPALSTDLAGDETTAPPARPRGRGGDWTTGYWGPTGDVAPMFPDGLSGEWAGPQVGTPVAAGPDDDEDDDEPAETFPGDGSAGVPGDLLAELEGQAPGEVMEAWGK